MGVENLKKEAGEAAAALVQPAMRLGLGTGSTVRFFLEALGRRLRIGEIFNIVGIPSSFATEKLARQLGIPLTTLGKEPELDLAVDGSDEIDGALNAIKGMGGALLREKIVAAASKRLVLIADEGKRVSQLGEKSPLPVEVLPFGWKPTAARIDKLGGTWELRKKGREVVLTDQSNFILDCSFPTLAHDPTGIASALENIPGVIGHGLFLGMADEAIVAGETGIERLTGNR